MHVGILNIWLREVVSVAAVVVVGVVLVNMRHGCTVWVGMRGCHHIVATEVVGVRELALSAGEESGALGYHRWSEGKLLAVENEHIADFRKIMFGISAFVLHGVKTADSMAELIHARVDILLVDGALLSEVHVFNKVTDLPNIIVHIHDRGLEGFEGDQDFGLHLDSLIVVLLVPNLLVFVKLIDLLVEVGTW